AYEVEVMATTASPYVSLRSLTGRSLRRVRVIPGRSRIAGQAGLEWAGDTARPGQQPATRAGAASAPAPESSSSPSTDAHYDDTFGPMPPAQESVPPHATGPAPHEGSPPASTPVTPSSGARAVAQSLSNGTRDAAGAMSGELT